MSVARPPSAPLLPPNRRVRLPRYDTELDKTAVPDGGTATESGGAPSPGQRTGAGAAGASLGRVRTMLAGVATIALAGLCAWGLVRYTRTSPRFSVRTLQVQGNVHTQSADLAKLGGLEIGSNIFELESESVKSRILQNPWIERVGITRRLPSTVRVEVVEREPAAIVALGAQLYLCTRDGEPFKPLESGDPSDLPIVTGIRPEQVAKDRIGVVATIKRALDLASEYERSLPAKTRPIQEVHADEEGAFSLVVGKDPVVLRMGRGPFRQPVEQAARVLAEVSSRHADAAIVFLDNEAHPERVVVRMR